MIPNTMDTTDRRGNCRRISPDHGGDQRQRAGRNRCLGAAGEFPAAHQTGIAYSALLGTYTKIGNMGWHFAFHITMTSRGNSSSNFNVSGLPFASNASAGGGGAAFLGQPDASHGSNVYWYLTLGRPRWPSPADHRAGAPDHLAGHGRRQQHGNCRIGVLQRMKIPLNGRSARLAFSAPSRMQPSRGVRHARARR